MADGKPAEAEAEYRQALAFDQERVNNHPGVPELHVRVAGSHEALGWLNSQTGKPGEAEAEYRRGLAVLQKIAENDPTNPRYALLPGREPEQARGVAVEGE